ncbi:MAG: tetratricopeptide repeat protein [Polyangiales bacterium]
MHNNAAAVLMRLGRVAEAAARFESARDASRRVGNAQTAAVAAHNLGVTRRLAGDLAGARAAQEHCRAEAERLRFARLAAFVAAERAWIALAAQDDAPLAALAAEAVAAAEAARAPALAASARAVALRAASHLGALTDADLDDARALAAASPGDARLELALAVWAAGGHAERDASDARAAFAAHVARVSDPDDRAACAASLARRHLVPASLLAGDAGGGTVGAHGEKE